MNVLEWNSPCNQQIYADFCRISCDNLGKKISIASSHSRCNTSTIRFASLMSIVSPSFLSFRYKVDLSMPIAIAKDSIVIPFSIIFPLSLLTLISISFSFLSHIARLTYKISIPFAIVKTFFALVRNFSLLLLHICDFNVIIIATGGDVVSTIGSRIRSARQSQNMSVDELAQKLGKNRATIYRYESDEIENFPFSVIEPLSKALNVSPAYLMGWSSNNLNTRKLKSDEKQLLNDYSKLNERGKKKVIEDIHNLTLLSAYTEGFKEPEPDHLMPKAAHERTDIDVTEEMRKHDDDIMKNF